MVGKYNAETGEVEFTTDHFSKYIIKSMAVTFNDVTAEFWGKKYIEAMASKGVINGIPDGSYDPNGKVTRAQFAKMLTIVAGLYDENADVGFTDVNKKDWFYKYVASAAKAGIILGYPDGSFDPDMYISRQDMAVMVSRVIGNSTLENADGILDFVDKSEVSAYAKNSVAIIVRSEIMKGKPGRIFDPKGDATRAEAAVVIYNYFNY